MNIFDLTIIGGGASGLMASLSASDHGSKVLILEKNNRVGKKILVTGNGRCNYTNVLLKKDDFNRPDFVENIFNQFGPAETIDYFENLGILPKVEDEGKTYPLSEQASTFLDIFLYEIEKRNISVELEQEVTKIAKNNGHFVLTTKDGKKYYTKKLILSTGGKSMSLTGSDGSGYELAHVLGHKTTEVFPALVKLRLDSPHLKHLSGVKINSRVDLLLGEEIMQSETGDILFANYGISGPTILELSRKANELMNKNKKPCIRIILIQSVSKAKIIERFNQFKDKEISQSLVGLINKRFISVLLKESGIDKSNILVKDINKSQLFKLIDLLYDWRIQVVGSLGFEDSQVTAGGIDLSLIDNLTLESKIHNGLYFTGEVLDIDGRCGGYNLQWAWSSGYVAGKYASLSDRND